MALGKVVVIEGVIGAGKSTLAEHLSERFGLVLMPEPVDANPFLVPFYKEPKRYAFAMQMHLLMRRFAMQQEAAFRILNGSRGAILDRSLPGDRVFCKLHMEAGNIDPLMAETYEQAFEIMHAHLNPPRLLLFLDVTPETALNRIKRRARGAESGIGIDYLRALKDGYETLLAEIATGKHGWSRGMEVVRLEWNGSEFDPAAAEAAMEKIGLT